MSTCCPWSISRRAWGTVFSPGTIDSFVGDRHVRIFAKTVSVENNDYDFLRKSFCCAADLLSLRRALATGRRTKALCCLQSAAALHVGLKACCYAVPATSRLPGRAKTDVVS